MKQLNLNSILITIVLALSAWTLSEVNHQGKDFAAANERVAQNTRDTADLRARVITAEASIVSIQIELARLKRTNP